MNTQRRCVAFQVRSKLSVSNFAFLTSHGIFYRELGLRMHVTKVCQNSSNFYADPRCGSEGGVSPVLLDSSEKSLWQW